MPADRENPSVLVDLRPSRPAALWPGLVQALSLPDSVLCAHGLSVQGLDPAGLARQCGIDAQQLQATVDTFNQFAEKGCDPQFRRGESLYNKNQGEILHGPNPSLGSLRQAPFYAVKLVPGSLGTFAGLHTDACARVLDDNQAPIPGLFAVGNDMNSIMNGHYPSGGITLGPGMTFGYIAGKTLAGSAACR